MTTYSWSTSEGNNTYSIKPCPVSMTAPTFSLASVIPVHQTTIHNTWKTHWTEEFITHNNKLTVQWLIMRLTNVLVQSKIILEIFDTNHGPLTIT